MNKEPPNVRVEKKDRGGINVSSTVDLDIREDTIEDLMYENGYTNAEVIIREDLDLDRFIDALMDNRKYLPGIKVVNKSDMIDDRSEFDDYNLLVSAETGENLEELRDLIFEKMGLVRVYMKEKNEEPDKEEPLILREGDTIEDALEFLPGDMKDRFKHARVTGPSSKFPEQKVGLEHELEDEDILQLTLRHI